MLPWSRDNNASGQHGAYLDETLGLGVAMHRDCCLRDVMTLSFMNNIGYIFIVRRLGKQSKLILFRLDSISNLELNLRYMAHVAQMLTQKPIYKPSSIFCFKHILPSAHKLILLIYGDNRVLHLKSCLLVTFAMWWRFEAWPIRLRD